ncbi:hypothetical protein [Persicitalea jodogahamensis]|uniref:DUF4374 domain-containing protein n=1 Tax=Persicitalea jodogahamensis TaxID=402147 RepID=A0A8J3G7W0_9BACT|nr:hypothetical protein [Persicitalea jodogahamensis]GHB52600.1 hypothetical protein GCM10007390_01590 [Persicitalea jodogahamensis]
MKTQLGNLLRYITAFAFLTLASCEKSDSPNPVDPPVDEDRWITVAGALMGTNPGDGNGGTMVYSVSKEDARNPAVSISVYDDGMAVKSNRTARLQSSEDGKTLFNIAYTGDNGGEFSRYKVNGAGSFVQEDVTVNISQYASTSPRWLKLFDGDKTGIAVNVADIAANNAADKTQPFKYYRGTATVLALDLQGVLIRGYKQYQIPLSAGEELQGHSIFRLDGPVLNKAQDKLIIGTWMRKTNPATGLTESSFDRLGSKSVVVDYPSLENPKVISSTVGFGDNSGYRSHNSFLATDGNIYQATQRDSKGSHILRINQNNDYDNSYVFSLDAALGAKNVYVDSWKYAGDGIAYAMYTQEGSTQGYIARLDLNAKTATKVNIDYDPALDFGQYQGILVSGDEVFVAVTPVGKDGNIYIFNKNTGAVTKGAKLVNKAGNHYIGVF